MRPVKLKIEGLPVDGIIHPKDAVVMVPDLRAAELIKLGHAVPDDGKGEIKNPDHNPLADSIQPQPPNDGAKPGLTTRSVEPKAATVEAKSTGK